MDDNHGGAAVNQDGADLEQVGAALVVQVLQHILQVGGAGAEGLQNPALVVGLRQLLDCNAALADLDPPIP